MVRQRDNMPVSGGRGNPSRKKPMLTLSNRWSLVSLVFPVIAGMLCAMAIMFNICALLRGWQEAPDVNKHISTLPSPAWAIALKAVSLISSAAAYILYYVIMLFNYDRVKGFTITVFGWSVSATILFSLIGVEARQHRKAPPDQSLEYTQNFFSAVFAASLYILIAILLAVYTACTRCLCLSPVDRRRVECTSIMLRAVTFATIILAGAAIYSAIEGWTLMDALYFTDYTVLTIGIGNIAPKTHLGRSLLFPYATAGTICLGVLVVSVASFANDMRALKLKQRIDEARMVAHVQGDLEKASNNFTGKGNEMRTVPIRSNFPEWNEVLRLQSIKSDFHRRSQWVRVVFFSAAWFILWLGSAAVFRRSEKSQDWSYFIALYFTYTSLTTIGYGDYYPTSNFGKVFFVFWSLVALPILTNLVTAMGQVFHRHLLRRTRMRKPHWHETNSQPPGEEGRDLTRDLALRPPAFGDSIQNKKSSSARDKLERLRLSKASTQHRLLLAEQIQTLLFTLKDESFEGQEDLCCTWARVIPLLHIGEYESCISGEHETFSHFLNPEHITDRIMDPKQALSESNAEYLWMLTLLVEKLCSDLREELCEAHKGS
ncbi:TOK2 potassium channel [Aspergillus germanicus]